MNYKLKQNEIVSGATHLLGALLSVVALLSLLNIAIEYGNVLHVVSFAVFGASLILLYLASTLYHFMPLGSKSKPIFRRIDHAMIFILIAGTYTPVCLVPLWGMWGWSLLVVVWGVALAGVVLEVLGVNMPSWASALIYLGMGCLSVVIFPVIVDLFPGPGIWWLVAGGLFYGIGVIFYGLEKRLRPIKWFGMHEIFHLFVMAGSFSHFWMMWKYIAFLG